MKRPDWFKPEPGFKYYDSDGDLCVVLGPGGYSKAVPLGSLQLYGVAQGVQPQGHALYTVEYAPVGIIAAVCYKNDWILFNLEQSEKEHGEQHPYWDKARPA